MGNGGYYVLVWDGYGAGLVMLNPRLLTDGLDCYGNPRNWFNLPERPGGWSHDAIVAHAIKEQQLPWLDTGGPPDDDWQGSPCGSTDYNNWKVIS